MTTHHPTARHQARIILALVLACVNLIAMSNDQKLTEFLAKKSNGPAHTFVDLALDRALTNNITGQQFEDIINTVPPEAAKNIFNIDSDANHPVQILSRAITTIQNNYKDDNQLPNHDNAAMIISPIMVKLIADAEMFQSKTLPLGQKQEILTRALFTNLISKHEENRTTPIIFNVVKNIMQKLNGNILKNFIITSNVFHSLIKFTILNNDLTTTFKEIITHVFTNVDATYFEDILIQDTQDTQESYSQTPAFNSILIAAFKEIKTNTDTTQKTFLQQIVIHIIDTICKKDKCIDIMNNILLKENTLSGYSLFYYALVYYKNAPDQFATIMATILYTYYQKCNNQDFSKFPPYPNQEKTSVIDKIKQNPGMKTDIRKKLNEITNDHPVSKLLE